MCAQPVRGFDYARNYDDFIAAMDAALYGPELKKIPIITYDEDEGDDDSHGFNAKPVKVTREGSHYIIDGSEGHHISHRRAGNDDQIYYKVIVDKNNIPGMLLDWDIKSGGLLDIAKQGLKEAFEFCAKNPDLCRKAGTAIFGGGASFRSGIAFGESTDSLYRSVIDLYQPLLIVPKDSWHGAAEFLILCIAHLAVVKGEMGERIVQ